MILIARAGGLLAVDPSSGDVREIEFEARHPSCLGSAGPDGPIWCGTEDRGVFRSDDGGAVWTPSGLETEKVTAIAVGGAAGHEVWAGTEPSHVFRSGDGGRTWEQREGLRTLASEPDWSFPPRPETDHVRWIACHPEDSDRLWVAVEAGALVSTSDGGRTWQDRVAGGPFDTHELAVDPARPDRLHSAAGDGYFTSPDGGRTWTSPMDGLDVTYLRSVALAPDGSAVVVSAASHAHAAYVTGRSDGRLYRREHAGAWQRVTDGWPDPPDTIAPMLIADPTCGLLLAADERGVHESRDGRRWEQVATFPVAVRALQAIAIT